MWESLELKDIVIKCERLLPINYFQAPLRQKKNLMGTEQTINLFLYIVR